MYLRDRIGGNSDIFTSSGRCEMNLHFVSAFIVFLGFVFIFHFYLAGLGGGGGEGIKDIRQSNEKCK